MKVPFFCGAAGFYAPLSPQPGRLLGGGGGNTLQEQLLRSAALEAHRWAPHLSAREVSRQLGRRGLNITHKTVLEIWARGTTTVTVHGGQNRIRDPLRRRLIRLVRGSNRLLADGTRANRHSLRKAVNTINDDAKVDADRISLGSGVNILEEGGLKFRRRHLGPGVTALNRTQRLAFRERHAGRSVHSWQQVVFSDATLIGPDHRYNRHNDGLWVADGERVPPLRKLRRPDSNLHAYGAITRHGIAGPVFYHGHMDSATYTEEILPQLLAEVKKLMGDEPFTWQQDGDGAHRSKHTQKWLSEQKELDFIPATEWPGNSPDINPIEGLWPLLQEHCAPPGQFQLSESLLKRRCRSFFRSVTPQQCRKLQESMARRMCQLGEADGWSITA